MGGCAKRSFSTYGAVRRTHTVYSELRIRCNRFSNFNGLLTTTFSSCIRRRLVRPIRVARRPVRMSPLSGLSPGSPECAVHFRSCVCKHRLTGKFSRLGSPLSRETHFRVRIRRERRNSSRTRPVSRSFLATLRCNVPPANKLNVKLSHLFVLVAGSSDVQSILLFPTVQPRNSRKGARIGKTIPTIPRGVSFSGMGMRPLFRSAISFRAFDGSSFHTIGIGSYATIGGDGGLLRFALSSKSNGSHVVLSNVRTFCRPRSLVNGAIVTVIGLPPEGVVNVSSYNVLLSTVRRRSNRRGLRLLVMSSRVPTKTGLC